MMYGMCIPSFDPVEPELFAAIESLRFDCVRQDVHPDNHELVTDMLRAYQKTRLYPIFLLAPGSMTRPDGKPNGVAWEYEGLIQHVEDVCVKLIDLGFGDTPLALEIGNEPDLAAKEWKKNPTVMGAAYLDACMVVEAFRETTGKSVPWEVLSPSISNLDKDSLRYLEEMDIPWVRTRQAAFHRYPNGKDFWTPQNGMKTRGEEVARLRQITRGADLWCTENGWAEHNGDHSFTSAEVRGLLNDEAKFWKDAGCRAWVVYQINSAEIERGDSVDTIRLKTYGLRSPTWTWKPQSLVANDQKRFFT